MCTNESIASSMLHTIGVNVFTFQRSPKVGFARSPWAIKKRNKNVIKDCKYNARIQLEAEILGKLSHPNIVGFRAFTYSSDGEPCLAMEKLEISLGEHTVVVIRSDQDHSCMHGASELCGIGVFDLIY